MYERFFRMFDFFENKDLLVFVVPKIWKAKGGKIKVVLPEKSEFKIIKTWAPFYHSHHLIIRGMLKGWMPFFPFVLSRLKKEKKIRLVYACSELNLLSTFYFNWQTF